LSSRMVKAPQIRERGEIMTFTLDSDCDNPDEDEDDE
jgi:hypothetical protein